MSNSEEYTPPPITGYRKLTQAEVDLVNEIKAVGALVETLMKHLSDNAPPMPPFISFPHAPTPEERDYSESARWRAIAKTHFQEGFMAASRSVLKPTSFA